MFGMRWMYDVWLFWVNLCIGLREQWRRSNNLAQVNGARLSESIRKPSQVLRELSPRWRTPVLSESPSQLRKEVSPKRESTTTPLYHFSSSRLGEGSSLERGKPFTWVRLVRLSENYARGRVCSISFYILGVCHMFGLITL